MNVLPSQWEAEATLIGCLILDPSLFGEVSGKVEPADLGDTRTRTIFDAMVRLDADGSTWDATVLLSALEPRPIHEWGGAAFVLGLPLKVASVEAWPALVRVIRSAAASRRVREAALRAIERLDEGAEPEAVAARLETEVGGAVEARDDDGGLRQWGDAIDRAATTLRERTESPDTSKTVPTGLDDVDRILGGGLRPKQITLIAARPGVGKTLAGAQIAESAARHGCGVAVFELEMSAEELAERAIVANARIDATAARTGKIRAEVEWRRILEANESLRGLPVYVDDGGAQTIGQIRSKLRRLKAQDPSLGMCLIDYLQLVETGVRGQSRIDVVSEVSRSLHRIGKELDLRMVVLAQLSRACEQRADKRPMPSDLRESGQIEQDAYTIVFLYRDELYNDDTPDRGVCEWIVAKQRGGMTGTVKVAFVGAEQRFASLARPDTVRPYAPRSGAAWGEGEEF